jgi:hypothetical protein
VDISGICTSTSTVTSQRLTSFVDSPIKAQVANRFSLTGGYQGRRDSIIIEAGEDNDVTTLLAVPTLLALVILFRVR